MYKKNNLSPLKPPKGQKNEKIKLNFEGLYFTIYLSNVANIRYVRC